MPGSSVLPEYVGPQVVSGQSAVGETPTANPVSVSGVDSEGKKRAIRTDADGRGEGTVPAAVRATKSFTAINDIQSIAVQPWMTSVSVDITSASGTFSATLQLQYSSNSTNGTDGEWYALIGRYSSSTINVGSTLISGTGTKSILADIPTSATYVRLICTAYTSGPLDAVISCAVGNPAGVVVLSAPLISGTARVGFMARPGVWTRESTTPVNATLSITGAAKTTYNTATGVAFNTATSYGDKFCAAAGADVAGTLIIEASPDSGTTWYPVDSKEMAQAGGAGNFGAYLETPICEATMRARLLNGATNQARAYLTTRMLG